MSVECSVEGCDHPARCRGWCNMHYHRWERHGDPTATLIAPKGSRLQTLLALMAEQTDECVLWPYTPSANGYGNVQIDRRTVAIHSYVCEAVHGPRPNSMEAAHRCGVRACVNPRHLRWATHQDNLADRVVHGTVPKGDTHWRRRTGVTR